jgi:hypothetical protein
VAGQFSRANAICSKKKPTLIFQNNSTLSV